MVSPLVVRFGIAEVASYLGLGLTRTWQIVHSGELPVVRDGRRVFVLKADLEAYNQRLRTRWDGSAPAELDDE